jgi:CBS domain-containing protein
MAADRCRIKQVTVHRDDRIVGIVSRVDLIRALAEAQTETTIDTRGASECCPTGCAVPALAV